METDNFIAGRDSNMGLGEEEEASRHEDFKKRQRYTKQRA